MDLDSLSEKLTDADAKDLDLDLITELMEADVNPHRVLIDCTNTAAVSGYYERWIAAGINIISPNRMVAAGPIDRYRRVCQAQRDHQTQWQFESSVGAALPILTTLRDLQETGDQVNVIRGSVSGTMAYALSSFSEEVPFSEAVRQAVETQFTEKDVRQDLSGLDMTRKVVILARQLGLDVEVADVEVDSLIPEDIINKDYIGVNPCDLNAAILEDLKSLDALMLERLKAAEAKDCVLRYKFTIDAESGKCKCSLEGVARTDALYRLKANENLVAFETSRYTTSPLIVKGAAAGPDLTAAGIFGDLLRLTRAFSSLQI
jgi:aspartokinase/homoserine dehydrogenase 1